MLHRVSGGRYRLVFVGMIMCCALLSTSVRAGDALVLGVYPSISTIALMKRYMPLRNYLGARLHHAVFLETAPHVASFVRRTDHGVYDIVVTAPHFGLQALDSRRYVAVAEAVKQLRVEIVVRTGAAIHTLDDLAGRRLALPARSTLAAQATRAYFSKRGMVGKRAPQFHYYISHNAAYKAVLAGDADAAGISANVFVQARRTRHAGLTELMALPVRFPGVMVLASTRMPAAVRARLQAILLGMRDTRDGQAVLREIHFSGYKHPEPEHYRCLRPFLRDEQALFLPALSRGRL